MNILTEHFVETLKTIVPDLQAQVAALTARVDEIERRKGGRPRKVDDVLPQGEAN